MSPENYSTVIMLAEVGAAVVATLVAFRRTIALQGIAAIATAGLLGLLCWLDWNAQFSRETPAHTYVLLTVLPVALCFSVSYLMVGKGIGKWLVLIVTIGVGIVAGTLAILTTYL